MNNTFYKNKEEIKAWLNQYKITDYNLIPDEKYGFIVDVNGSLLCSKNKLTNLEFCPTTVNGVFSCSQNDLTSLKFCPTTVNSNFYCYLNQLTSLKFCPITVNGNFDCSNNNLSNLEFCPANINGYFSCNVNLLSSLEFCPKKIDGRFDCSNNNLSNLEFFPEKINGDCYFLSNPNLGSIQHEHNFKKLYLQHKRQVYLKLKSEIDLNNNYDKINKNKIKI